MPKKLWFARSEDGDEFLVQAETEDAAVDLLQEHEGSDSSFSEVWEVELQEGVTVLLRQR